MQDAESAAIPQEAQDTGANEQVVEQEGTAVAESTAEQAIQPSPEALELERIKRDYAGLQRSHQGTLQENQKLRDQAASLQALDSRSNLQQRTLEAIVEHLASQEIGYTEPEEEPVETPIQRARRELREQGQQRAAQDAPNPYAPFITAASAAGFTPDSPEIVEFFAQPRTPEEALRELPNLIARKGKETNVSTEDRAAELKRLVDEAVAPVKQENATLKQELSELKSKAGLTTVEAGGPSAGGRRRGTPYEISLDVIRELKGEA